MTVLTRRRAAVAPAGIRERQRLRASTLAWLTPASALLVGLFLVPIGYAIYLGFTNLELLGPTRSEEHTSELQSRRDLVCRLLLEKKKKTKKQFLNKKTKKKTD